ncbi:hypothetical protein [Pseudoxanthomonas sacheonensis]|uniref:Uncharacterized protein n=1 Tax=Pseudoxanthomonas sacheonensis TaxID=443615 RepID=A0ABU1RRP5_9GAMM|nr:hypothetical protein [Pseudoxanthomonas sacheonensis]MDR6840769.1 hypothetical protein [Pseudoxanthomonas sacheonensis]
MFKLKSTLLLVALAGFATAAHARQDNEKLADCVDLPADYQAARFGSQYLLVKDGDNYYRLGFNGSCSAIAVSPAVKISTDGQANRLCPRDTKVSGKRDSCSAREVVRVDQDEYEKYVRRQR